MSWHSSLGRSGMARVNEGSHSFTCHPHVYPQVEWTIPAFTPQPQSITALWLVLLSRPTEGSRMSWPGLSDRQCKGTNAPSLKSPVEDEERPTDGASSQFPSAPWHSWLCNQNDNSSQIPQVAPPVTYTAPSVTVNQQPETSNNSGASRRLVGKTPRASHHHVKQPYTRCSKKRLAIKLTAVTLSNVNQFSKFFHC